ncbi:MAG: PAS domain S-box protein [Desulfobacterales bacterium]|nr:PAS domain S-box protein [Desulfobacterales bacterium]
MQIYSEKLCVAYALSEKHGVGTGVRVMLNQEPSKKELQSEIIKLRQENARLKREKSDLEVLVELNVDHGDFLEETLFEKVESALRESEKRFRLISETIPVPIIVSRVSDNAIVYANDPAEAMFGFSSNELMKRKITDFHDNWKKLSGILISKGDVSNYEIQGKNAEGAPFWAALFIQPLEFSNEPCLLYVLYDMTEHKLAEEALQKEIKERVKAENELKRLNKALELRIARHAEAENALSESEKKYRSMFENALEGIFQTTPNGRIVSANPSTAHIMGYDSPEDLINSVTDVRTQVYFNPRQRDNIINILSEQDLVSNYECQMYRKDRSVIWVVLHMRAIKNNNGKILHVEGLIQDITERKLAEEQLRASEKKYRELYEGSRDGWASTDMDGRFQECNSGFLEMLGYTPKELQTLTFLKITPEKYLNDSKLFIKQVLKRGYSDVFETELIRKDGSIFPVELRAYMIKSQEGESIGFWGFARDITEKKAMQEETMHQARLASIGELAAGVAHEINNPINSIINYAQLLVNRIGKESEEVDISKRIIKEGDRIEKIVRNLLSFAREGVQDKCLLNIRPILSECIELTKSALKKDSITVKSHIPADLPTVKADAQQLQQVFLSIISNARYALNQKHKGSDTDKLVEIKTEVIEKGDTEYIRTVFHDSGAGIPADILDRVCDPFFSTKPANTGTGLGLSTSHGIVKNHEGRLWFESKEGEYTKTIIDLPIHK